MDNQGQMKTRMSFDEMAEAFVQDNPGFYPNRSNVGRYAKKMGYILTKQMRDYKRTYFYVKNK